MTGRFTWTTFPHTTRPTHDAQAFPSHELFGPPRRLQSERAPLALKPRHQDVRQPPMAGAPCSHPPILPVPPSPFPSVPRVSPLSAAICCSLTSHGTCCCWGLTALCCMRRWAQAARWLEGRLGRRPSSATGEQQPAAWVCCACPNEKCVCPTDGNMCLSQECPKEEIPDATPHVFKKLGWTTRFPPV